MQGDDPAAEHLPLALAAVLIYHRLARAWPALQHAEAIDGALNRIAAAVLELVPVHTIDPRSGIRRTLRCGETRGAQLIHGGSVMVAADGERHAHLSLRRGDLPRAIAALPQDRIIAE